MPRHSASDGGGIGELKYKDLRSNIKTGDCILWQGESLLSRVIRYFSEYSHASLVIRLNEYEGLKDRVFLVEALSYGLKLKLLSERIRDYDGKVFHFEVPLEIDERDRIRAFSLIKCAEGIPYDYHSLFWNALGRVNMDAKRYFCSEFVWAAWRAVGFVGQVGTAPRPGDIPKWVKGKLARIEENDECRMSNIE